MPFYEYQCQACGAHHEALQKMSDAPLRKCPECGKSKLTRLISAPVFRLKGGGWYETDFKSDQERKRNLAGDEAPPPAAADKPLKADKSEKATPAADAAKPAAEGASGTASRAADKAARGSSKSPATKAAKPGKASTAKGPKAAKGRIRR
jgi:putative FmdB family regulatory protein